MDKQTLIDEARSMLGTPFRHEGRSSTGVDCYGLFIVLGERLGITVPVESGYGFRPSGRHMRLRLEEYATKVQRDDMQPGDILHMKLAKEPQHLALVSCIDPVRIIHADNLANRVVEHVLGSKLRDSIRGIYRVKA